MGGLNTIFMHNTCEDSLLAAPLMLDLVLVTELCERITVQRLGVDEAPVKFHSVLSLLSFFCKAPLVPPGAPVINALFAQRYALVNVFRACVGLAPENHMLLEHRLPAPIASPLVSDVPVESLLKSRRRVSTSSMSADGNNVPFAEGESATSTKFSVVGGDKLQQQQDGSTTATMSDWLSFKE